MHKPRLIIAASCLALLACTVGGAALPGDGTCTWVGDNEVCVPPR